ncbi:MAG: hypothetical protein RBU37_09920 [Myxococcota bacterium]|nr:hypothetical protein [Myxococcota bacterium]
MWTFDGLLATPTLNGVFESGQRPEPSSLCGWAFRGAHCLSAIPGLALASVRRLRFLQLFEAYEAGPQSAPRVGGYHLMLRKQGRYAPWVGYPRDDAPHKFGFFELRVDERYPQALLLDFEPTRKHSPALAFLSRAQAFAGLSPRLLREYLVHPDPSHPDLFLGRLDLGLGPLVHHHYFVLERFRKLRADR